MAKEKKKRNKKYNPNKSDDYINPMEHVASNLKVKSLDTKQLLLNNSFTIDHLLNEGLAIYYRTYIYDQLSPDYNASNVRSWVEKEFDKLDNIQTRGELNQILSRKIKIHWQVRDLLLEFIDEIDKLTCGITSRNMYAKLCNEAYIRASMRTNLVANSMLKFINQADISEAQDSCRRRLKRDELVKAKKEGKIAYFDDTGDIIITDKGVRNGLNTSS
jgi:hypothetical protein